MLYLALFFLCLFPLSAEEPKPAPTVEELQAKVQNLETQLAQLNVQRAYESKVCNAIISAGREMILGPQQSGATANPNPRAHVLRPPVFEAKPKTGTQP